MPRWYRVARQTHFIERKKGAALVQQIAVNVQQFLAARITRVSDDHMA